MSDLPVTRGEMRDEVHAAEARSGEMIDLVTSHFDKRLTDSERVLTWRMIAVGGVTGVFTSVLEVIARGQDSAAVGAFRAASRVFT